MFIEFLSFEVGLNVEDVTRRLHGAGRCTAGDTISNKLCNDVIEEAEVEKLYVDNSSKAVGTKLSENRREAGRGEPLKKS